MGKTAVAEGLAQRIAADEVPEPLRGKRLLTLDLTGMVAGTKYRGDFEERVKNAISEVNKAGDVLLFKGSRGMRMELILEGFLEQ